MMAQIMSLGQPQRRSLKNCSRKLWRKEEKKQRTWKKSKTETVNGYGIEDPRETFE